MKDPTYHACFYDTPFPPVFAINPFFSNLLMSAPTYYRTAGREPQGSRLLHYACYSQVTA
jgi:hypothetical protein